ncbi:MAG TPA: gamma-glutamyl-gamma-aminobutyrate hydrolase family protein [Thermoleophilaceae bacterium]|jgi:putative glutamine amidotransferase
MDATNGQPVIGLCAVRESARWSFWEETAHLVSDTYVSAVQRTGAVAVILPVDTRAPLVLLDRIDALIAIGGADLDPSSYGAERDERTESTYPERDAFELALIRGAIEREMPVLGICRGMQALNVALGGTLVQHIPEMNGTGPHRRIKGTFDGNEQTVCLDPGSLAATAVGEEIHIGRCHHHQAVDVLGEGLLITGRAQEDGMIEAIEIHNGLWVLGVQWHPEVDEQTRLFAALADAARARSAA